MKAPKQADQKTKEQLAELLGNKPTKITLDNGKVIKIGWMRPDTQDKLNDLITDYEAVKKKYELKEGKEVDEKVLNKCNRLTRRFYAKSLAAILLNNYFGLRLLWWAKWRWLYYFADINANDYLKIIIESKKKAQPQEYYMAMALLMDMTTMTTTMTKKEAEEYRQELELAREHQSLKSSQP